MRIKHRNSHTFSTQYLAQSVKKCNKLGNIIYLRASLVAQLVKNPAMPETWVWSLDWEDPLEKGTAVHSSILGLENSMDCSMGSKRIGHAWAIFTFTFKQLHMNLWDKCFYHHHFTEDKTEADRQSDLPKATQHVKVQKRDSNLWCLSPETMYLARIQKSFYFYNPSHRKWELSPLKMEIVTF